MNSNSPELMPTSVAASAALASTTRGDGTAASTMSTLTGTNSTSAVDSSSATTIADASSALITPTKGATSDGETNLEQHSKKDKKRQLQLQLTTVAAIGKSSGNGTSTLSSTTLESLSSGGGGGGETTAGGSSMASKKQHKKLKSTEAAVSDHESRMTNNTSTANDYKMVLEDSTNVTVSSSTTTTAAPTSSAPASMMIKWPPVTSAKALPPLSGHVLELDYAASSGSSKKGGGMQQQEQRNVIEFEVNQECTSIGLVPSGRLAVAGFTDGTLRLFDLTGYFAKDKHHYPQTNSGGGGGGNSSSGTRHVKDSEESLFDDDASTTSSSLDDRNNFKLSKILVDSHSNQRYGAVACQIHARGVHTSLLMDVAISEDGLYAFGGVQRGSVELAAVYLGDVENYFDEQTATTSLEEKVGKQPSSSGGTTTDKSPGLLDLIQVDRHADAKLKGFGACTRLWNGWERVRNGVERPEYLLFTGKGIKNIHIWSYRPSRLAFNQESEWSCLYDTQTNGTSITQLYFRHNAHGMLQGISKSDDQKLRVWDLSYEQRRIAIGSDESDRPKRPEYVDVASTEGTIGVCGPYAFASGSLGGMHNIINVVGLDADDASSPFNCSELALPLDVGSDNPVNRHSRTGRQQRGDLKSVVNVAGLVFDASHALLQLSDGSVVHYLHDQSGHPMLLHTPASLCTTCVDDDVSIGGSSAGLNQNKAMALARVGSQGMVLFAVSSFNENTSRGAIMLRALPGSGTNENGGKSFWRYWGFNGLKRKRKQRIPGGSIAVLTTAPVADSVTVETTPIPVAKIQKDSTALQSSRAPLQTTVEVERNNRRKSPANDIVDYTPVPLAKGINNKAHSVRKVTPGDLLPTAEPIVDSILTVDKSSRSDKKRRSEDDQMDIQLQIIVHGYNSEAAHSPKRSDNNSEKSSTREIVQSNQNEYARMKHETSAGQSKKQVAAPVIVKKQKTAEQGKKLTAVLAAEKRGGKSKIEPSKSSDTSLSAPEAVVLQPAENEAITKKVCFLGMTILDRKVESELPESCFQPKQRPVLLVEQLPRCTVGSRLTKYAVDRNSNSTKVTPTTEDKQLNLHCDERQKLAARHRAEHEMLRRKILHSIRYVLSTWDIELNSNKSHASIVESAKKWFDKALESHEEVLNDILWRQEMEAESLAARQTSELDNERAPVLHVAFPFPQVFEQARQEMIAILR